MLKRHNEILRDDKNGGKIRFAYYETLIDPNVIYNYSLEEFGRAHTDHNRAIETAKAVKRVKEYANNKKVKPDKKTVKADKKDAKENDGAQLKALEHKLLDTVFKGFVILNNKKDDNKKLDNPNITPQQIAALAKQKQEKDLKIFAQDFIKYLKTEAEKETNADNNKDKKKKKNKIEQPPLIDAKTFLGPLYEEATLLLLEGDLETAVITALYKTNHFIQNHEKDEDEDEEQNEFSGEFFAKFMENTAIEIDRQRQINECKKELSGSTGNITTHTRAPKLKGTCILYPVKPPQDEQEVMLHNDNDSLSGHRNMNEDEELYDDNEKEERINFFINDLPENYMDAVKFCDIMNRQAVKTGIKQVFEPFTSDHVKTGGMKMTSRIPNTDQTVIITLTNSDEDENKEISDINKNKSSIKFEIEATIPPVENGDHEAAVLKGVDNYLWGMIKAQMMCNGGAINFDHLKPKFDYDPDSNSNNDASTDHMNFVIRKHLAENFTWTAETIERMVTIHKEVSTALNQPLNEDDYKKTLQDHAKDRKQGPIDAPIFQKCKKHFDLETQYRQEIKQKISKKSHMKMFDQPNSQSGDDSTLR